MITAALEEQGKVNRSSDARFDVVAEKLRELGVQEDITMTSHAS